MTVPLWLAQVIVAALVTQFIAVAIWMIRQDRNRAVAETKMEASIAALSAKVDVLTKTLETHNPVRTKADADALEGRVLKLESGRGADHKLLRHLQRRMDRAQVPEVEPDGDGD